jgi:ABC-type amino acid transport substrate-binding protein
MFENVSVIFKLEEHLVSLAQANPAIAVILTFVLIVVGANVIVTQVLEFRKFLRGRWIHHWLAWVGLAAGLCAVLLLSINIVQSLKESTEPVPKIVEESTTVIGQPLRLQWTYQRPSSRFEIESSKDASFGQELKREGYRNGNLLQIESVNDTRYWRVRAVDSDNNKISGWSVPVRIAQYDSSLIRIQKTQFVSIYMSDSINEAFFKFEAKDANSTLKGYDVAIADEIVKNLNVKLGIAEPLGRTRIHVAWQELLSAPSSGRADMIISTITALTGREEKLGLKFSKPYYCTTQSLVYRSPMSSKLAVPQMIANKRVGAQSQTTSESLLKAFILEDQSVQSLPYKQTDDMIAALVNSQIDYGFTDTPFARAAQRSFRGLEIRELTDPIDFPNGAKPEQREEKYAIAVRAGESELINAINQIIDDMREGRLGELLEAAIRDFDSRSGRQTMSINKKNDPSDCRAN